MRRLTAEEWSGIAMLVVSVAVAAPTLLGAAEPVIPHGWWTALFALFLAALLVSVTGWGPRALPTVAFGVSAASCWAIVLTGPGTGLVPVLLVITAGISVYLVPLPVGGGLVAANTLVVALSTARAGAGASETVILTGFYILIQVATLLSSLTLLRERRMRRELSAANVALRAANIRLAESTRTAERLRISRELHDSIGHQLTVLALELETARHVEGTAVRRHLDRAGTAARELLSEVRATVGQLRSEPPDLEGALRRMSSELPGLEIGIEVEPGLRLGEEQLQTLLRAAQEIITNTIRHAEATRLRIEVGVERVDENGYDRHDVVVLDAHDNGVGTRAAHPGNGLRGLTERIEALAGSVELDGSDGFRVRARIPAREPVS